MEFVKIAPGEFQMGCALDDPPELPGGIYSPCPPESKPAHRVRIKKAFEIGKFEVTQAQWQAVMGKNPSYFVGSDRPVEQVLWSDVQEFLSKLNARNDGYRYRLPTEAEWEYCARAGSTGQFGGSALADSAWYGAGGKTLIESAGQTYPVGQKAPNAWGLYDCSAMSKSGSRTGLATATTNPGRPSIQRARPRGNTTWLAEAPGIRMPATCGLEPLRDRPGIEAPGHGIPLRSRISPIESTVSRDHLDRPPA
jgi:hypothetical protein